MKVLENFYRHYTNDTHLIIKFCGIKLKVLRKKEKETNWHQIAKTLSDTKKRLLFIDDMIPETDKHAGAKSTMGLINTYKNMGLDVLFLPDNYTNISPYDQSLRDAGVQLVTDMNLCTIKLFKCWLKIFSSHINYILLSRPHVAAKYIDEIKKYKHIKILYYGQDLHFLREKRTYEVTREKKHLLSSKEYKKMEYNIIKKADVIYFPSIIEKNIIKKDFPIKTVDVIPVYTYALENLPEPKIFEERKDILFVGNFKHTPNEDGLIWYVNKVFGRILEKIPNVKLNIAGSNINETIQDLKSTNINILGFVSDKKLSELYKNSRVIIAPLRFGAGMKGKVIEALYNQIPIVTTSIGAEGIENIGNIITIADNEDDFASSVIDLYTNQLRNDYVVQNSLKIIENQFTNEITKQVLSRGIE